MSDDWDNDDFEDDECDYYEEIVVDVLCEIDRDLIAIEAQYQLKEIEEPAYNKMKELLLKYKKICKDE